jgi:hypothetical protein
MMQSLRVLLDQIVDYAGLFPPAGLPMDQAVASYADYRRDAEAWMLGRFVVPVARLGEFEAVFAALPEHARGLEPWWLSALAGPQQAGDMAAIARFNRRHAGRATIDVVELKAAEVGQIDAVRRALLPGITAYVELPIDRDPRPLVERLRAAGSRAKVRTGGVTPEVFPAAEDLARFLAACVAAGVPFKATAGLHHPLRAAYRLTYAPDSATAPMYGFLNVFLAAGVLRDGGTIDDAVAVLCEGDSAAFVFDAGGVAVCGRRISNERLALVRRATAIAFGSCSFREPVDDLRGMGLM